MSITKDKMTALNQKMKDLGIKEDDLIEKFITGSGKGGQKVNKTSSCVYLKHLPTGIEVKCQKERSRELNRFLARRALCEALEGPTPEKEAKLQKVQKQKKTRQRKSKKKHSSS